MKEKNYISGGFFHVWVFFVGSFGANAGSCIYTHCVRLHACSIRGVHPVCTEQQQQQERHQEERRQEQPGVNMIYFPIHDSEYE